MCELSGGDSVVRFLKPVLLIADGPLPFSFDIWPTEMDDGAAVRDNRDRHLQLRTRFEEVGLG